MGLYRGILGKDRILPYIRENTPIKVISIFFPSSLHDPNIFPIIPGEIITIIIIIIVITLAGHRDCHAYPEHIGKNMSRLRRAPGCPQQLSPCHDWKWSADTNAVANGSPGPIMADRRPQQLEVRLTQATGLLQVICHQILATHPDGLR